MYINYYNDMVTIYPANDSSRHFKFSESLDKQHSAYEFDSGFLRIGSGIGVSAEFTYDGKIINYSEGKKNATFNMYWNYKLYLGKYSSEDSYDYVETDIPISGAVEFIIVDQQFSLSMLMAPNGGYFRSGTYGDNSSEGLDMYGFSYADTNNCWAFKIRFYRNRQLLTGRHYRILYR